VCNPPNFYRWHRSDETVAAKEKNLMNESTASAPTSDDLALLRDVTKAVTEAGIVLLERFSPQNRVDDLDALLAAIDGNDDASIAVLRPALDELRPEARWDDDEEGHGALARGEWWVADAAEGNVNHIHGGANWGVTATLVRDDVPVITAVFLPALNQTFTAIRGGGAFLNGSPITVSAKSDLTAALVGTGQAKPGEAPEVRRQMSASIDRMLDSALLVSATVPATLQLVQVAAGHTDAFWQYGQVRSGLVAGALLVQEAHGAVIDTNGAPWTLTSNDFLATTPGLASSIAAVLR
jgi:myo-inositol-1(or 4)-monophosphatase